jgi:LuxR family transcriptional regulator, maltose regulon positive regulatory protein
MPVSIIPTKLIIPKRAPGVIHRARLIDYVHENLGRKLLLVTAPAGYGKTTLLVDFANDSDLPVCWYTLDEGDRDPSTFLSYLIAALRQKFPQFGERSQPLAEHGPAAAHAMAAALVADMVDAIPDYFVLVLDDWHLVSDEAVIVELLDQLMRYLPEHAHIIVAGRTLLRGPLVRLAAQGAVAGLGPSDLRFTADEVREVLAAKYRLTITVEQAAQLAEESEGWITAIVLTSQRVWQNFLAGLIQARDSVSTLFEYLAGEVFDRQPVALRRFLFDSAVPRQFTAALCDDLRDRGDAQDWIFQVEDLNLFLTRLEANGEIWYRYHHLFRDFLVARFKRDEGKRFAHVQGRAGELFEARQQPEEAVEHFTQAGSWERAARVMNANARSLFIVGRTQTLARWFQLLPPANRADAPELLLYHAQTLSDRGQLSNALQLLQESRAAFAAQHDVLGQIRAQLLEGWTYHAAGRLVEALNIGQAVTQQINAGGITDAILYAQSARLVGTSFSGLGKWQAAEPYLNEALRLYRESPVDERRAYNLGRTMLDLANALRSLGRLEEAATLQAESLGLWQEIGNPASLAHCLNNMGYDRYVAGDYSAALTLYTEALLKAEEAEDRRAQAWIMEGIATTYRDRGEFDRALEAYAQIFSLTGSTGDQALVSLALDGLGHAHRLSGNLDRAVALFEQARSIAERESIQVQVNLSTASLGIAKVEQEDASGMAELEQASSALRETNAYLDLGRVLLWLARAQHVSGNEIAAQETLTEMVRLGRRLGCRPFPLAEEYQAQTFLQWGAERLTGDSVLHKWINELHTLPILRLETAPVELAQSHLEVRALGPGQVLRDGQPLAMADWGRSINARELFFYLLEYSPRRKEEIGVQFWPDLSMARMTSSFHAAKYRVRRALGVEFVEYDGERYRINPALSLWYDVAEFRRLIEVAHEASNDAARSELLKQAVALYGGDYLPEVGAEWAERIRSELHLLYFDILGVLVVLLMRQRCYEEVIVLGQRGLEIDYFHEELHRAVMLSLALTGRSTGALRHYETMASQLAKELNVTPTTETVALVERIRVGKLIDLART